MESLQDISMAQVQLGARVDKVFVADGRAGEEAPMWLGRMGMSRLAVRVPEACGALLCGGAELHLHGVSRDAD